MELKTPDEWCAQYDILIVDPDGWRGTVYLPWLTPITLHEFYMRGMHSTVDLIRFTNEEFLSAVALSGRDALDNEVLR